MKILELELVNHVVIPEKFHINLRDKSEVICIDGLNGSGKSFLINNIHPLSSNKRFKDRYPIRKGKGGLKRIVYEIDRDIELEVIHEYVVSGERHSCKSYCNILRNGHREELNPTGHNKLFEEVITKYLNFDSDTFICSFLSPKGDSIVSSTPAKRREILQNTMKSSKIIENIAETNRGLLAEAKSSIKMFSKQIEDLYRKLPLHTEEEFENKLSELESSITRISHETEETQKKRANIEFELDRLNRMDTTDLNTLNVYLDTLKKTREPSISKCHSMYYEASGALSSMESSLDKLKIEIRELKEAIDNESSQRSKSIRLEEIKKEISDIENANLRNFRNIYDHNVLPTLGRLARFTSDLSNEEFKNRIPYLDICNLEIERDSQRLSILEKFIQEYDMNRSISDNDSNEGTLEDIRDNCEKCPYFTRYYKMRKYVEDNAEKYSRSVKEIEDLEVIISAKRSLLTYVNTYRDIQFDIEPLISNKEKHFKFLDDVIGDEFFNQSLDREIYEVGDLISIYKSNHERLSNLSIEEKDMEIDIIKSSNIDLDKTRRILEDKRRLFQLLSDDVARKISIKESIEPIMKYAGTKYDAMNYEELSTKANELSSLREDKSRLNRSLESTRMALEGFRMDENRLNNDRATILADYKNFKEFSKYLVMYKEKVNTLTTLKNIVEKRIPLKLLSHNIDYIEEMVNSILEENDINISMSIQIEETDIRIAVFTRNQEVDDISMCSSGELCLLGVALNAVLMHIIGYTIISFDEMDSNLDIVYRESFSGIIYTILEKLDIEQIFCVSHNISFDMNSGHIVLGDYDTERMHGELIEY